MDVSRKAMDNANLGWRELYRAALLELDHDKLLEYIKLADQAIREQMNLAPNHAHYNPHDQQAMQDALRALRLLQRSALRE
jgi:hypothetical protein